MNIAHSNNRRRSQKFLPVVLVFGFLINGITQLRAQELLDAPVVENFSDSVFQESPFPPQNLENPLGSTEFTISDQPIAGVPWIESGDCDCGPEAKEIARKENEKKEQAELNQKVASAFKPVFFDNDFSYLCDDCYNGYQLGDCLKKRRLPNGGCYDIGGQYRVRAQFERNMRGLGLTGLDDEFLLQRTRIYGDFRFTPNLRVYAEMLDAESNQENSSPRPIEVNRADMLNLFFDARLFANDKGNLLARVGRQELLFGAQRMVSPLDWANTRRTFDGFKLKWSDNCWDIDAFWTHPVRVDDHSFDAPDRDQEFMGIWSTYKGQKDLTTDVYYLRYINGRGTNNFEYDTVGFRHKGKRNSLLWELQAAAQYGENTDGSDHSAGMATLGVGRNYNQAFWKPTAWLFYDWASGDQDLGAGNGYDHLFPLAHKYLGFMDLFGRRNIEDANILITAQPTKKLKLLLWYHYFLLATQSDSPYSVVMTPFNGSNLPGSPELGHEIDFVASYQINPRQDFLFGYSRFFSGNYYDTTAGVPFDGNADFFYAQWTVNF